MSALLLATTPVLLGAAAPTAAAATVTAPRGAPAAAGALRTAVGPTTVRPVRGAYRITARYGQKGRSWSSGYHTGLDFAAPTGRVVQAVQAGSVIRAGWAGAYGYRVQVRHANGHRTFYAHLSYITVYRGSVRAGQEIGRVGATGNATGPHLHLEFRPAPWVKVDPLRWLARYGVSV